MTDTTNDDRRHITELVSNAKVARLATFRVAVTKNPDNDPITNDTVEL